MPMGVCAPRTPDTQANSSDGDGAVDGWSAHPGLCDRVMGLRHESEAAPGCSTSCPRAQERVTSRRARDGAARSEGRGARRSRARAHV